MPTIPLGETSPVIQEPFYHRSIGELTLATIGRSQTTHIGKVAIQQEEMSLTAGEVIS
jgi:hypothetical protein